MPSLEDSALVHGFPPRRPWDTRSSDRTAQRGTQSALAFVQGAFFFDTDLVSIKRIQHWHSTASKVIDIASSHCQTMDLCRSSNHRIFDPNRETATADVLMQSCPGYCCFIGPWQAGHRTTQPLKPLLKITFLRPSGNAAMPSQISANTTASITISASCSSNQWQTFSEGRNFVGSQMRLASAR